MSDPQYDVLGIGMALVDVLSQVDDAFLKTHGMSKGQMVLIEEDDGKRIYDAMGHAVEIPGGSAANSLACLASLGGTAAFIGKLGEDHLADVFVHETRAIGVHMDDRVTRTDAAPTGRCLICVPPDGDRAMNTLLGACTYIGPDDILEDLVASSAITLLEGYQWDTPHGAANGQKAVTTAHAHGRKLAMTISAVGVVERHRDAMWALLNEKVDILFANEAEANALFQTKRWEEAADRARDLCDITVITRSEHGSVVIQGDNQYTIDAIRPEAVVDATGAGDAYAAGFLYGITHGRSLADSGRIGAMAAAEVISHIGPRPEQSLKDMLQSHDL